MSKEADAGDRCPATWSLARFPFVARCTQKADVKGHGHKDKDGIPPPKGNYKIEVDDVTKHFTAGDEELLALSTRIGPDGGFVLVCTLPHACGTRVSLDLDFPWESQARLRQITRHVRGIPQS